MWSSGNLAAADELYSNDFVCHLVIGPEWRGVEGIKNEVSFSTSSQTVGHSETRAEFLDRPSSDGVDE